MAATTFMFVCTLTFLIALLVYSHMRGLNKGRIDIQIDQESFEMNDLYESDSDGVSHEDVLNCASDLALVITNLPSFTMVGRISLNDCKEADVITIQGWGDA